MARAIWSSSSSPGLGGSGRTAARARPGRARVRMAIESVRRITVHLRARGRWGFSEECWYFTMPPPAPVGALARLLLDFSTPMAMTSSFSRRFRLLTLLRGSLVAGAVYDLGFAALMVAAPGVPARMFNLPLPPLPRGAFYPW